MLTAALAARGDHQIASQQEICTAGGDAHGPALIARLTRNGELERLDTIDESALTVDLAAGHGRNSEFLRRVAEEVFVLDIQPENVEACRQEEHASVVDCSENKKLKRIID